MNRNICEPDAFRPRTPICRVTTGYAAQDGVPNRGAGSYSQMALKRTWFAFVLCMTLGAGGCATLGIGKKEQPLPFIEKTMVVNGNERVFAVYVPENYDRNKSWPLVVFLHGAGERGEDGREQTEVGIGPAIVQWPERFPCIVLMPQCPSDAWWSEDGTDYAKQFSDAEDHIDESMRLVLDEYNIDPKRIYLTGLSMGGYGTWSYGVKNIDTFAALVPICGGGRTSDAEELKNVIASGGGIPRGT